ncbi:MAG: SDR family NAD(P)-dependent oxidoreductase [Porticoccaceae bacterium]|nr:SDR family NAD(P)-dependent oxidoreductase [Porticoccaceae bacterium]
MRQAIIVGASSGLGWELAIQLADKGYQLGVMGRREALLNELVEKLPGTHFIRATDVSNAEQSQTELEELIARMGDVELIVLSSGVGLFENKLEWAAEREMIDVNVRGFAALTIVAMEHFTRRGAGHLAGISSMAAHIFGAKTVTYHATKAFVSNYLAGMRQRAIRSGLPITITTIEPGFIKTPMVHGNPLWMAPVEKGVTQMVAGLLKKKNHIYITKRWRYVALVADLMPHWLLRKFL